ncbi:MAG: SPFH domain-containing protein [Fimbriimonadaceae bacterium]|nr:SPFH domain-containing protein [Fimbriimonadaceae bacterium]
MTREKNIRALSGWLMLIVTLAVWAGFGYSMYALISSSTEQGGPGNTTGQYIMMFGTILVGIFLMPGFFVIQPNTSKVLTLFGKYVGTVRDDGFHWANPFYSKITLSLRAQTLNGDRLKVNDLVGNPVEIATIVVWQVEDTFKACFEVENYAQYVALQTETALRHSASSYPYDSEDDQISLMRNGEEVSAHLKDEVQDKLNRAGVKVLEARLSHLAYAPEIAGVMLRKQQAAAIIAARQRIVDGAVGMVEMALAHLAERNVIDLDNERKAAMVSNLMVVLCSESAAQPVLNTGSLYT